MTVHWKDKRDVYCLSTIHSTSESVVKRKALTALRRWSVIFMIFPVVNTIFKNAFIGTQKINVNHN